MRHNLLLRIKAILSIVLMTLHFASDTLRAAPGSPESGGSTLVAMPLLALFVYGALLLHERRTGHVLMFLTGLIAAGMPVVHVLGPAGFFTGYVGRAGDPYLFVWTLHALVITGLLTMYLALRGLWTMRTRA